MASRILAFPGKAGDLPTRSGMERGRQRRRQLHPPSQVDFQESSFGCLRVQEPIGEVFHLNVRTYVLMRMRPCFKVDAARPASIWFSAAAQDSYKYLVERAILCGLHLPSTLRGRNWRRNAQRWSPLQLDRIRIEPGGCCLEALYVCPQC
jgi:hypothetical protein